MRFWRTMAHGECMKTRLVSLLVPISLAFGCSETLKAGDHEPTYLDPGSEVSLTAPKADGAAFVALAAQVDEARSISRKKFDAAYAPQFDKLTYDPLTAQHLDRIQDSSLTLDPNGLDALAKTGFVIQKDPSFPHFQAGYDAIYSQDLPLYVTSDSILQAVHESYDDIVAQLEMQALSPALVTMLANLAHALTEGRGDLADTRSDLDLYLTVARSLLAGSIKAPLMASNARLVRQIVSSAEKHQGSQQVRLFGIARVEDFSQFEPRGHYTDSIALERYFRAMIWLGRLDFRLIETEPDGTQIFRRRQADAMFALADLFDADTRALFETVDSTVAELVGESDYMSLPQVRALLDDLGVESLADTAEVSDETIAKAIVKGNYGEQNIASHFMVNDRTVRTLPLNRSFALLGQRYVLDSHVFSNVVWDRTKAQRMMPNPLDVAFAALHNDQAASLLGEELDTYAYQGDLNAMRVAADAHGSDFWNANLYNRWLQALRGLSPSERSEDQPSLMKTEAWGRRVLNTQLASWAQLRHDTILYVKQSYTTSNGCEYPDAYVDPYPAFYAALVAYGDRALAMTDRLEGLAPAAFVDLLREYFTTMRGTVQTLGAMAEHELSGMPFDAEQLAFINEAVRIDLDSGVCGGPPAYLGWYPRLFFQQSADFDPTIADVHTQPTEVDGSEVGRVLHVGTGAVRPMIVTLDTCEGPRAYAGLVSSYHEVVTEKYERLTDAEWSESYWRETPEDVRWMRDLIQ